MGERPALEVADIIRRHGDDYRRFRGGMLSLTEEYVLRNLAACRTAVMGGHVEECEDCGKQRIAYNSCGNRHCPKCQAAARAAWLEARRSELLPVPYFHVVFTLPEPLARLAWQNKPLLYNLLFRCAAETLQQIAADPEHLGAEIGFLAVLHTWGQNLMHHPHVHCVVPGGGLSLDSTRWIGCRDDFFLPVRVLSRLFRGKFLARLKQALAEGKLSFHGQLTKWASVEGFERLLAECFQNEWVVYAKRPFGGPEQVLKYLARYTHRVAISNHRLIALEDGQVTFRWKNYAQDNRQETMTLPAVEFLRRFLLHILPSGFVRIRQYGLLANCHRAAKLARCRELLAPAATPAEPAVVEEAGEEPEEATGEDPWEALFRCPACGGQMRPVEQHSRPTGMRLLCRAWPWDTS